MLDASRTANFWNRFWGPIDRRLGIRGVLAVAAFLRLASIPVVRSYLHPETWEFGPLAEAIRAGFGYSEVLPNGLRVPSVFMPPAYSYVLAFFYWLAGERPLTYFVIEVVQAAFGVLLIYVVYRLALLLLGKMSAIAAACIMTLYPAQVYMCNEFHGISIYIVLGVSAVYFLALYLEESPSWKYMLAAGLCMGGLMLFRSEAPALVVFYSALLLARKGWKCLGHVAIFALVATACLAPWTIRNYLTFGKLIPTTASGGYALWVGNNSRATGSQHYDYFKAMPQDVKNAVDRTPLNKEYQVRQDVALKNIAVRYMFSHPRREAILAARKLFLFFVFDPAHDKGRNSAYWVPSVLLTILAIYAIVLRPRMLFGKLILPVLSIFFAVAVGVVVLVLPRYKIEIDPFIIIIASTVFTAKRFESRTEMREERLVEA